MINELNQLEKNALAELQTAETEDQFSNVRTKYLGRKGLLTGLLRNISQVSDAEKPLFGKLCNELKNLLNAKIDEALQQQATRNKEDDILLKAKIDVTLPGNAIKCGRIHPVIQIRREICSIFSSFGFSVVEGPEIDRAGQDQNFRREQFAMDFGHVVRLDAGPFPADAGAAPRAVVDVPIRQADLFGLMTGVRRTPQEFVAEHVGVAPRSWTR
jgi:phenylalanyl-tRNA synthetase alpha subunit